jgi:hypothetical protein
MKSLLIIRLVIKFFIVFYFMLMLISQDIEKARFSLIFLCYLLLIHTVIIPQIDYWNSKQKKKR